MSRRSHSVTVRVTRNYFRLDCGILAALFTMDTLFVIFGNIFLTKTDMTNLLRTCATNCHLAIGIQFATMLTGIDPTGGTLAALGGVMCVATFESFGLPMPMDVAIGILVGVFMDLINSVIITYTGIHPFVMTLAMQSVCRGAAYLIANSSPVITRDANFNAFGAGSLGVVSYPVIYTTVLLIMDYFLLSKLGTEQHIYAVDGDELSARFSGIDVKKMKILVWTINGTITDFYGTVLVTRLSSDRLSTGEGHETDAIVAIVLGGASLFGGTGTAGGLMIGVLVIGVISNGLNLMHINSYWQFVLKGIITIVIVYFGILK